MALASEMAAEAAAVCEEYGSAVVITRQAGGQYNPETRRHEGGGPETIEPKCLVENKGKWLDGKVIGEKKLTFSAQGLAFEPAPGMTFQHKGVGFTVMQRGVDSYEISGETVLFEVYGVSG